MLTGWLCPQCQAVMAPQTASCVYCKPKQELKVELGKYKIEDHYKLQDTLSLCKHGTPAKFVCVLCTAIDCSKDIKNENPTI